MTNPQKLKIILVACALSLVAVPVFAAEIRIDGKSREVKAGEQFTATISLNTEESINAIEGRVVFPADLLELKEIKDGNSIINFWIDPVRNCVSNGVEKPDSICFAGIIPGGYKGRNSLLFSLAFRALKDGEGVIEAGDMKVLRNDGQGTAVATRISGFQFLISHEAPETQPAEIKDIDPPETFRPEVASDPALFDGQWFLVFATQDKGSGIDHYEIREGFWGGFRVAESPYLLQNQSLDKKIFVKVVDKNGNARIEVFRPPKLRPWYENYSILIILIVGIALLYLIRRVSWKRNTK